MPPLDSRIDDLYKGALQAFIAARTALAKTLSGDEAKRVKALQKPTVVPWAVNQVYWHARPVYDRLVSSGEKLRAAQIDALKGRSADVRRATDAHRKAVSDAVAEALRQGAGDGAKPGRDELAKTLEAISLARGLPEPPGRLTRPLQPAGFEALAGVPVKALPRVPSGARTPPPAAVPAEPAARNRVPLRLAEQTRSAERKRKAEEQRKQAALERADASVARAKAAETQARAAWERAKQALEAATLARSTLQGNPLST